MFGYLIRHARFRFRMIGGADRAVESISTEEFLAVSQFLPSFFPLISFLQLVLVTFFSKHLYFLVSSILFNDLVQLKPLLTFIQPFKTFKTFILNHGGSVFMLLSSIWAIISGCDVVSLSR